jgi:pimeloyl-ACP methyl ester carboxylesterase/class 3 adenylate cyclase
MKISDVHYARSADGIDIAYQVVGEGPTDIVHVSGFISHLDMIWEIPPLASRYGFYASLGRLVMFDKRGTGLSDRSLGFGSASDRMDDIRAVMDAAGVERAVIYAISEGGPLALLFAATYPDRVSKLVLYGAFARVLRGPDYPEGRDPDQTFPLFPWMREHWGTGEVMRVFFPDAPEEAAGILARYERASCTPQMTEEIMTKNVELDVRDVLQTISVPTLVIHATGDPIVPVECGRYLAEHIPGARLVEIGGQFHGRWQVGWPEFDSAVTEFISGEAHEPDFDRMLSTVLFTDIVSSTQRAAALGDQKWRDLLDQHDRITSREVERFRGRLVKTTGDGLLATFDGPARAIGCARSIEKSLASVGVDVRAGLHTGEIELRGEDVAGIGVVIARRICDSADGGEILTSRTVKDLVAGSGLAFEDRGTHALKGVPDDWQLYAVGA